jgi:tetratricopeptide (TPR) repeat protein
MQWNRLPIAGLLPLALVSGAGTVGARVRVNHAALSCISELVRSRTIDAALLAQSAEEDSLCAAAIRADGKTESAPRWAAMADIAAGRYEAAHNRLLHTPPGTDAPIRHFFLGLTAHALGRSGEAIHEWTSLDQDGRVLEAVSDRLMILGQVDAALRYYEAAVSQRPDSADAHFKLAEALYRAGQLPAALDQYRRGFASASKPASIDVGEVAYHQAQILSAQRDYAAAIAAIKKAVAARPRYPNYTGFLAALYAQSGDQASAVRWLEETVRSAPASGYPYWEYGRYYMSRHMPDQAVAQLERSVQLDPAAPAFYYGDLGAAYFAQGKLPQAIAAWTEARRRDPGNATYSQWLTAAHIAAARNN